MQKICAYKPITNHRVANNSKSTNNNPSFKGAAVYWECLGEEITERIAENPVKQLIDYSLGELPIDAKYYFSPILTKNLDNIKTVLVFGDHPSKNNRVYFPPAGSNKKTYTPENLVQDMYKQLMNGTLFNIEQFEPVRVDRGLDKGLEDAIN